MPDGYSGSSVVGTGVSNVNPCGNMLVTTAILK